MRNSDGRQRLPKDERESKLICRQSPHHGLVVGGWLRFEAGC
jgi:hypothetical protein